MTLPTGQLSLSQLQDEFGGSTPISLSEYYRGGPYVSISNDGVIPYANDLLELSRFMGTTKYVAVAPPPPVIAALVVNPNHVYDEGPAGFSNYTANFFPSVSVSGGVTPYTYNWSFSSLANGFTLHTNGTPEVRISRVINRFGGDYYCTMQCVVTDSNNPVSTQTVLVNVELHYYDQNNPAP